ncbi:MAG: hypothetical protein HY299_04535 [Verrucomicrobia bacterium]|nr:hypothetical protein [Verrucomicrobiota bacterium]
MPLENSCTQYTGELVFVLPIVGYGWCRIDPNARADQPGGAIDTPHPFHAKLVEFQYHDGKIVGGIGTVEEPNHPLDKEWVAFCIRDRGTDLYDLTTNPGKYNVGIGKNRPTIKIDLDIPMPQWMQFDGPPIASGFGFIAESETQIKEKYDWLK